MMGCVDGTYLLLAWVDRAIATDLLALVLALVLALALALVPVTMMTRRRRRRRRRRMKMTRRRMMMTMLQVLESSPPSIYHKVLPLEAL